MKHLLVFFAVLSPLSSTALALTIALDYSLDSNMFFANATAKAAVDQAAADIGAVITTGLSAVDTPSFTSGIGTTAATFTNVGRFKHPATDADMDRDFGTDPVAADTVVIYVGSRALTDPTLGTGGFSLGVASSGFDDPGGTTAGNVTAAAGLYNAHMERGGGLTLGESTISINTHPGTVRTGSILGQLWFDHDTNDDMTLDTDKWHFDHTMPVGSGMNDLYSVALHEILHSLGIGASKSWDDQVSGTTWLGAEARAATGNMTGAGLVDGGGGHIAEGIMGTRLSDGMGQEVVMDPTVTTGTRKSLTDVDLAFLRDSGWATIPEPSSTILIISGLAFVLQFRRRRVC